MNFSVLKSKMEIEGKMFESNRLNTKWCELEVTMSIALRKGIVEGL